LPGEKSFDEAGETTRWRLIRDRIVEEITSGRYLPGAALPSIRELMRSWGVSDSTAKRVLAELVNEGWAQVIPRRGHVVARRPNADGMTATRPEPGLHPAPQGHLAMRAPVTVDIGESASLLLGRVLALTVRLEMPTPEVAFALRLPDLSEAVVARRRILADASGVAGELRTSWLPQGVAMNTPLAFHEVLSEPWPVALARLSGRVCASSTASVRARRPDEHEMTALGLSESAIVLVRAVTTADPQSVPLDVTRSVWPADSTTLTHSTTRG
jgi:DNA-binding GntR family transcriptional regulator